MEFYYHGIDDNILVISADGGLNHATAQQFVQDVERMVDSGLRKIIVDCKQLTYISSYGLGVLLQLHRRLKKHDGDVKICSVGGAMMKVMRVTRLDRVFDIYEDIDQAEAAFAHQEPLA